ncbi:PorT family protein [bacterium]|nr:PorT family protein [bacterium]
MRTIKYLTLSLVFFAGVTSYAVPDLGGSTEARYAGGTQTLMGFQGGVSAANVQTPSEITSNGNLGLLAGAHIQFRLNEMFSIQPEAMFSRRGFSLGNGAGVNVTAQTSSIEVPVLARVNFGSAVVPYLFAGPVAIFNISNSVGASAGNTDVGSVGYNPRTVDFAATVGAGVQFQSFFLNLRYTVGLLGASSGQTNYSSRGAQLLAGFNLGV